MVTNPDGSITLPPAYASRYKDMARVCERISLEINELIHCIDRSEPNLKMAKNRANDIQDSLIQLGFDRWAKLQD